MTVVFALTTREADLLENALRRAGSRSRRPVDVLAIDLADRLAKARLYARWVRGTMRQRQPGTWELRVPLPRCPDSGRRRQLSRSIHGTEEQARAALRELIEAVSDGERPSLPSAPPTRSRGPRRFPFAELERVLAPSDHAALAEQLGVVARTVHRLRGTMLTAEQADHYAIRAGLHPAEVWPDWPE